MLLESDVVINSKTIFMSLYSSYKQAKEENDDWAVSKAYFKLTHIKIPANELIKYDANFILLYSKFNTIECTESELNEFIEKFETQNISVQGLIYFIEQKIFSIPKTSLDRIIYRIMNISTTEDLPFIQNILDKFSNRIGETNTNKLKNLFCRLKEKESNQINCAEI